MDGSALEEADATLELLRPAAEETPVNMTTDRGAVMVADSDVEDGTLEVELTKVA